MLHRLASSKDFDAVYELYMDETSNPYLTYDPMDRQAFESIYNELLETSTQYVVELDDEIAATYRLIPKTHRQTHTVYLGGFVISKTMQGKGLGTAILSYIKETIFSEGKTRLELTVDLHNTAAISLYKKMGFEIEGQIKMSYKLSSTGKYYDEYLMGLILS